MTIRVFGRRVPVLHGDAGEGESNFHINTRLKAFRSGKQVHEEMSAIAAGPSDDEIHAAADW